MAGDWIKMRCELGSDPDVIRIAAELDIDEFAVVGRLHAVWSWLDQHSEDGTNVPVVSAYLDRLTACPGFADAMRHIGWLTGRDGSLTFPNYETHNGSTAKSRAYEQKRKQRQRLSRDKPPATTGTTTGTNVPEKPGPEKRREEKSKSNHITQTGGSPPTDSIPKLDDVLRLAKSSAMAISEECATAFYDEQEARGWVTNQGFPIANWQAALRRWASKWNANESRRPAAVLNASHSPRARRGYNENLTLD